MLETSVIEAAKALGEACLECGLAVLNGLRSRKTTSPGNECDTGISLLGLLRAWEELRSLIETRIKIYNGGGEGSFLFEPDEQRFEFERLYVHACFLRADYSSAIISLHKLFQVKKVMARFESEYNNPRRFLFGQQGGANVKNTTFMMPFLSFIYGPIWKKTVKHQLPRPGLNGFRDQGYLDNSSDGPNVKEQAAVWYADGSLLRNLDATKDLLRIWIDCLGRIGNTHERDRHAWQDEVDAIPRIHSAETIVVVYTLAKALIPTISGSSSWRQTTGAYYPLAGTDENSGLRDDSRTANFSLSIPEANDNVHGHDDLIFGEMELE
ncbi:hypothetical protein F5Y08DRAFT_317844 [Xylaria arbuscula]|nr:hypothetical protein F5Y08DRAFT_317844 [Xylaria arbuscula]